MRNRFDGEKLDGLVRFLNGKYPDMGYAIWYQEKPPKVFVVKSVPPGGPYNVVTVLLQYLCWGRTGIGQKNIRHGGVFIGANVPDADLTADLMQFLGLEQGGIVVRSSDRDSIRSQPCWRLGKDQLDPKSFKGPGDPAREFVFVEVNVNDVVNRASLAVFRRGVGGESPPGPQAPLIDWAKVHRIYMMAAWYLVLHRQTCMGDGGVVVGHNIGSILVGPTGRVLAWGLNTVDDNYTFHAEVNAIQSYWSVHAARVPAGSFLYTTLKSCKMCAGVIWANAGPGAVTVFYDHEDTGKHATGTRLDVHRAQSHLGAEGHPDPHEMAKPTMEAPNPNYVYPVRLHYYPQYVVPQFPVQSHMGLYLEGDRVRRSMKYRTTFLNTQTVNVAMSQAVNSLERKFAKYAGWHPTGVNVPVEPGLDPNVKIALGNVAVFLKAFNYKPAVEYLRALAAPPKDEGRAASEPPSERTGGARPVPKERTRQQKRSRSPSGSESDE